MDSQEAKTDTIDLPKPSGDASTGAAVEQGAMPESNTAASSTAQPSANPSATLPLNPLPSATAVPTTGSAVSAHTATLTAEDADLIEKTWIEKAKQIVAETRGDPYVQNKEINKVKADYIKKRYNKDIKLTSE